MYQTNVDRVSIGGISIDAVDFETALESVARPSDRVPGPRIVATVNLQQLSLISGDDEFARVYSVAHLVLPDGWPVAWVMSRILGRTVQRVTGADLLPALLDACGAQRLSVAVLGGRPGAASALVERQRLRWPGAVISCVDGVFVDRPGIADLNAVAELLEGDPPDVIVLALGSPKSERWSLLLSDHLGGGTIIGVGAGVDFLSGHVTRAGPRMQRMRLEWLYRLYREPRRLARRYAFAAARFVPIAVSALRNGNITPRRDPMGDAGEASRS